jgi:hypothetical protein
MRQKRQERFWTASAGREAANPMDGGEQVVQRIRAFETQTVLRCWPSHGGGAHPSSALQEVNIFALQTVDLYRQLFFMEQYPTLLVIFHFNSRFHPTSEGNTRLIAQFFPL